MFGHKSHPFVEGNRGNIVGAYIATHRLIIPFPQFQHTHLQQLLR